MGEKRRKRDAAVKQTCPNGTEFGKLPSALEMGQEGEGVGGVLHRG